MNEGPVRISRVYVDAKRVPGVDIHKQYLHENGQDVLAEFELLYSLHHPSDRSLSAAPVGHMYRRLEAKG